MRGVCDPPPSLIVILSKHVRYTRGNYEPSGFSRKYCKHEKNQIRVRSCRIKAS